MAGARVLATAVACLALGACAGRPPAGNFTLSLVGTNDLHGAVLETNGRGGLALLDGYLSILRAARQQDGGAVLVLDGGDLFQGTLESNLTEGSVVVDAYNTIGYQAATIGNHEFDYGPVGPAATPKSPADDPRGALKQRLAQSRFPWVASNLIETATGKPVSWPNVSPSTILTVNGVRIGIVGLITSEALSQTIAANVPDLSVAPLDRALIEEATRLRSSGATIVIGLAHAGGQCTDVSNPSDLSSCDGRSEILDVARAVPGGLVDAIVAGHRHSLIAHVVNGIPIIESASRGRDFGRIDFAVDRNSGRVTSHHVFPPQEVCERQVPGTPGCAPASAPGSEPARYEGRDVVASPRIAAVLEPAVARTKALKEKPLGSARLTAPLVRSTTDAQSPVADLEADWMRALVPGADLAIMNSGGLRANLPAGPLTYGRLYELMPFDNLRMVISLTGAQLRTVIAENMAQTGSIIVLSGVRARARCTGDQLTVDVVRDTGVPIPDNEVLKAVTNDFLVTGGDGFFTSIAPVHVDATGDEIREEMAAMLTRDGGTWGEERVGRPHRIQFPGRRPLVCAAR